MSGGGPGPERELTGPPPLLLYWPFFLSLLSGGADPGKVVVLVYDTFHWYLDTFPSSGNGAQILVW